MSDQTEDVGHNLWQAARAVGGEPDLEWTFDRHVDRIRVTEGAPSASRLHGIEAWYEPLSTWEETVFVVELMEALMAARFQPEDLSYLNNPPSTLRTVLPNQLPGVLIGWEYFESAYYTGPDGRLLPQQREGDTYQGRHATFVTHADRAAETLTFTSWSPRWGNNGHGYMSREYFEKHVDSVIAWNVAYAGLSPAMDRQMGKRIAGHPTRSITPDDFIKSWMTPNPLTREEALVVGEREFVLRSRRVFSLGEDIRAVDLFEVREGDEAVARMHLFHGRGDKPRPVYPRDETVIEELFVHPSHRRLGLGAALVEVARDTATLIGKARLIAPFHECDESPGGIAAAEGLASKSGFTWKEAPTRRPNTRGHFAARVGSCADDR